jgi:hypothetical protein
MQWSPPQTNDGSDVDDKKKKTAASTRIFHPQLKAALNKFGIYAVSLTPKCLTSKHYCK